MNLARLLYIGVTLLHFTEREVWRMTPYKLLALFRVHKQFHPERFPREAPEGMDEIDAALGGL